MIMVLSAMSVLVVLLTITVLIAMIVLIPITVSRYHYLCHSKANRTLAFRYSSGDQPIYLRVLRPTIQSFAFVAFDQIYS